MQQRYPPNGPLNGNVYSTTTTPSNPRSTGTEYGAIGEASRYNASPNYGRLDLGHLHAATASFPDFDPSTSSIHNSFYPHLVPHAPLHSSSPSPPINNNNNNNNNANNNNNLNNNNINPTSV